MGVLKGLTIALAGDIKDDSSPPKSISVDQLKKWIHANGGTYVSRITPETTHLVASKEAYKKNVDAVKKARPLPTHIVTYAWLEDSLHRRRKLAERKYTWEVEREQRRRRKVLKRLGPKADGLKFEKGCEEARGDLGSGELTVEKEKKKGGMGFFKSALGELGRRRVEREKEGEAARAGVGHVVGSHTKAPTTTTVPHEVTTPTKKADIKGNLPTASTPNTTTPTPSSCPNPPPPNYPPAPPSQPTTPTNAKLQDLYHIYLDASGFEYKLLLLRQNHHHNTFARYDLRLYESHSLPHVYCTLVRYTPPALPASTPLPSTTAPTPQHSIATTTTTTTTTSPAPRPNRHLLTPPSSPFAPSFLAFRHAFRDLTLLSWHERLGGGELQRLRARAFRVEPFVWRGPARGLPVGLMPGEGYEEGGYVWNRWGLEGVSRGGEVEVVGGEGMGGGGGGMVGGEEGERGGNREDGKKKVVGKGKGGGKGGRF